MINLRTGEYQSNLSQMDFKTFKDTDESYFFFKKLKILEIADQVTQKHT